MCAAQTRWQLRRGDSASRAAPLLAALLALSEPRLAACRAVAALGLRGGGHRALRGPLALALASAPRRAARAAAARALLLGDSSSPVGAAADSHLNGAPWDEAPRGGGAPADDDGSDDVGLYGGGEDPRQGEGEAGDTTTFGGWGGSSKAKSTAKGDASESQPSASSATPSAAMGWVVNTGDDDDDGALVHSGVGQGGSKSPSSKASPSASVAPSVVLCPAVASSMFCDCMGDCEVGRRATYCACEGAVACCEAAGFDLSQDADGDSSSSGGQHHGNADAGAPDEHTAEVGNATAAGEAGDAAGAKAAKKTVGSLTPGLTIMMTWLPLVLLQWLLPCTLPWLF